MHKYLKIFLGIDLFFILVCLLFLSLKPEQLALRPTSYVLEAADGALMSASIASDGQWRFPIDDTLPEKFEQCILSFEDKRFYRHMGLDLIAFGRAIRQNLQAGKVVSGGSTISMQVVRLAARKERSILQKAIEIIKAFRLELKYSKKEILALYSAHAPFGSNVVGLEAAAWRYYGRAAHTLSWAEMATLSVLPNSPSLIHPGKNRSMLLRKRNRLLDKLAARGIIDEETAYLSKQEPIPAAPQPLPQHATHLLQRFKTERQQLKWPNTRVQSTLDAALQRQLEALLVKYQSRYVANGIHNLSALVLDIENQEVKAYVGNTFGNFPQDAHVDMIKARRSPGSTLKPLLYAAMLNDGFILPKTLVADIPTQIAGFMPQNYDLGFDGAIPADQALSRSLNIPSVRMLQQYKYERFYNQLKRLGMQTLNRPADHYGLSLILGGSEVTMWDLSNIYMGMARSLKHYNKYQGNYNTQDYRFARYIPQIKPQEEKIEKTAIFDHASIWNTFNAMEEVMRPGDEGLWEQFSSSSRIAWKTGTSFGFRDAWSIGLNAKYVVCVWVGNANGEGRPGLVGIETAAPVMFDVFKLLPNSPWFKAPVEKLKTIKTCKQSGYKAGPHCTESVDMPTTPQGEKTALCPYHQMIHLDGQGLYRVTDDCERPSNMLHKSFFVLPPAMEHYYKLKHSDYIALPPFRSDCQAANSEVMEVLYPKPNSAIYVPVEINGEKGRVVISVAHRSPETEIFWHLDQSYIGSTTHFHQMPINPGAGKHTLTLVDKNGNRLSQQFTILDRK